MSSLGGELIEKDVKSTSTQELQKVTPDSSLKNNLDRLTIETLRSLCSAKGLPETGNKKDLAEHFATKITNKIKGKETTNMDDSWQSDEERYINQYANNLRKDFQRKEIGEQDQFEYEEWRKVEKLLDEALTSKSWDQVMKTQEITYTRAYMLRIVNKEK
ncbi:13527_t:CDS:2 [Racocetra fulgida]|uniref:13527_t:CDS:1 n=1 Tax=Racocetra fulgida TaxID=60492 RepID=A0A9N9C2B9_9GLOM|nr:13527_t:CDS:2 [Racocetra fulgida]